MKALAFALAMIAAGVLPAVAADYTVVLNQMQFGALPAQLHPGDTITWQNDDIFRHSATALDGSFDLDLPAGESASMTVGAVGSVPFYCTYHPGMTGTLVISPP
jgi:plastocyanin